MGDQRTVTDTKIQVFSRKVSLTYLQTQQVAGGGRNLGQLAGSGGGVGELSSGSSDSGDPGFMGIGGEAASSTSTRSSDTGWIISRTWLETHFNMAAYRVGLRDVGAYSYEFNEVSEFVSVAYRSPKPISKVMLTVAERIPSTFPVGHWIEYYITSDDGKTWHRINPTDHPPIVGKDGQVVPTILTFNPEAGGAAPKTTKFVETADPVYAVRLRVVFRRPPDLVDSERHTPLLKRYRLKLYPQGGL